MMKKNISSDNLHFEKALYESKQRLEALMNALPVGVSFSNDISLDFITGNQFLFDLLELHSGDNLSVTSDKKNIAGHKLKHYQNGELIPTEKMPMQRSIRENREIGPMEIEIMLPSGKKKYIEARAAPIRDADGKVIASVAVNIDLTERKRADEADKLERLMEQENLRKEFIADATHELRTPLAIIKGHVDLALRTNTRLSVSMKDTLNAINNEIVFLANLLSDLSLLITTKGDGMRKFNGKKIELSNLIMKTALRHQGFADKKGIVIKINKMPKAHIIGDEGYLERLFSNIIINAISYGKDNGHVSINASRQAKEIRIDIEDNGIGIPEEDLPHIFDRFYRVDSSRSKDSGGSGLGLAIVKWIAEAHGGKVSATSVTEKGSTFSVTFPLHTTPKRSERLSK